MKLGICLTPIYPKAIRDCTLLEKLIDRIYTQKFFACVEIYFEGTKEERARIRKRLEDTGLKAVYLGGLPIKRDSIDISSEDEKVRQKGVDACKRHMEYAVHIGCEKIVIGSGPDWGKEDHCQKIIEQMRRSLETLDAYSKGMRLNVSVEPFPTKTEPYLAVGSTSLVRKIFDGSKFQNVGITFDTSHISQMGEDIAQSFYLLQPWIQHLHLANCVMKDINSPLYGDKHPCFCQEGGELTVRSISDFYRRLEEQGMLEQVDTCSLEIISRGNEDWYYEETCKEAKAILGR